MIKVVKSGCIFGYTVPSLKSDEWGIEITVARNDSVECYGQSTFGSENLGSKK